MQCIGTTKAGPQCQRKAVGDSVVCSAHVGQLAEDSAETLKPVAKPAIETDDINESNEEQDFANEYEIAKARAYHDNSAVKISSLSSVWVKVSPLLSEVNTP